MDGEVRSLRLLVVDCAGRDRLVDVVEVPLLNMRSNPSSVSAFSCAGVMSILLRMTF
jgi:hypothetical protein